jgi:hypothetical protein
MSSQPQSPGENRLRASDADRDQTVELLASADGEVGRERGGLDAVRG